MIFFAKSHSILQHSRSCHVTCIVLHRVSQIDAWPVGHAQCLSSLAATTIVWFYYHNCLNLCAQWSRCLPYVGLLYSIGIGCHIPPNTLPLCLFLLSNAPADISGCWYVCGTVVYRRTLSSLFAWCWNSNICSRSFSRTYWCFAYLVLSSSSYTKLSGHWKNVLTTEC